MYYSRIFSQNLRKYLNLAFIDHRGFGLTNKATTSSGFELKLLIDDIESFRQYLGFDKVIIVGRSGHGYMALEYAKTYPHSVSPVVLLGMGFDQSLKSRQAAQSYFDSHASEGRKLQLENDTAGLRDAIANSPNDRFITFCP